jgi:membrane protease YdiL (CAAX protease family)
MNQEPAPLPAGGAAPGGNGLQPAVRRAPELREMALIGGLAFFLNLFPGTLLQILNLRWGLVLTQVLFIAAPVLMASRWFYLDPKAILSWRRPGPRILLATFLGTAGLNHVLTLAGAWQETVLPTPESVRAFFEGLFVYRGPVDFALLLLTFAVVPALCEELLFRGFLQAGLVRLLGSAPKGIAVSSLIFAAFHLDPWRFPGILVLGLFLGLLAHRGGLVPAILAHALNNVLSISVAVVAETGMDEPGGSAGTIGAALAVAIAAWLLRRKEG